MSLADRVVVGCDFGFERKFRKKKREVQLDLLEESLYYIKENRSTIFPQAAHFEVMLMCARIWTIRCVITHYRKDEVNVDQNLLKIELEEYQRWLNAEMPSGIRQF